MKKYLPILFIILSFSSYGTTMNKTSETTSKTITQDELIKLLEKSSISKPKEHKNHEKCYETCDRERTKTLQEIRNIQKQVREKMLDRETGNKTIKQIKNFWNDEHPTYQIR